MTQNNCKNAVKASLQSKSFNLNQEALLLTAYLVNDPSKEVEWLYLTDSEAGDEARLRLADVELVEEPQTLTDVALTDLLVSQLAWN